MKRFLGIFLAVILLVSSVSMVSADLDPFEDQPFSIGGLGSPPMFVLGQSDDSEGNDNAVTLGNTQKSTGNSKYTCSISVKVIDSVTGKAISNAKVRHGWFHWDSTAPYNLKFKSIFKYNKITASAPGYKSQTKEVSCDQPRTVTFKLVPTKSTVTVDVVDAEGNQVNGRVSVKQKYCLFCNVDRGHNVGGGLLGALRIIKPEPLKLTLRPNNMYEVTAVHNGKKETQRVYLRPGEEKLKFVFEEKKNTCNDYCQATYGVEGKCSLWCSGQWTHPGVKDKCPSGQCCCKTKTLEPIQIATPVATKPETGKVMFVVGGPTTEQKYQLRINGYEKELSGGQTLTLDLQSNSYNAFASSAGFDSQTKPFVIGGGQEKVMKINLNPTQTPSKLVGSSPYTSKQINAALRVKREIAGKLISCWDKSREEMNDKVCRKSFSLDTKDMGDLGIDQWSIRNELRNNKKREDVANAFIMLSSVPGKRISGETSGNFCINFNAGAGLFGRHSRIYLRSANDKICKNAQ